MNSPTAGMKTSRQPPMMPGTETGSVASTNACQRRAPRSAAASEQVEVHALEAQYSGRIMNSRIDDAKSL